MTASQETDSYLSFDDNTHAWIQQLHEAWSSDAPISTFATIRDALLERREHLDTYVSTLGAVVKIARPRDVENNDDGRWNHFFNLGALTKARGKENDRKRKRTYNEANRLRNLALLAALWSPAIVFHYGWNTASQIQMNMLRICATRYPRFVQDFRPRLNQVLFNRHCEGIKNGRTKSLTEARLQPHRDFDINTLSSVVPDESISICWVNSRDGNVPIDGDGTLLRVVRPQHFHQYLLRIDRYGILDARKEDCRPCSPPASGIDLVDHSSQVDAQSTMEYQDPNLLSAFSSKNNTFSSSDPSSRNTPQPSSPACTSILSEDIHFSNSSTAESTEDTAPTSVTSAERTAFDDIPFDILWDDGGLADHDFDIPMITADFNHHLASAATISESMAPHYTQCQPQSALETFLSPATDLPIMIPCDSGGLEPNISHFLEAQSSSDHRHDGWSMEEALHAKYKHEIAAYTRKIVAEANQTEARPWHKLRTQWYTPTIEMGSAWTSPGSGLLGGQALSQEEADVLYLSSEEAMNAAQRGDVFGKPIIIKHKFTDAGMHTVHNCASLLQIGTHKSVVEVESLEHRGLTPSAALGKVLIGLHSAEDVDYPISLKLRDIIRPHRPPALMLPRFRLLDMLAERITPTNRLPQQQDLAGCIRFTSLSMADSFSGTHLGAAGGIWLRNLDGLKFCTLIFERDMDPEVNLQQQPSDMQSANNWVPNGKQKLVILEPDDVLFIPPGLNTAYALHSPTNVLIEGGIVWDSYNILPTLNLAKWLCNHHLANESALGNQLTRLVEELMVLVENHPHHFLGKSPQVNAIDALKQGLSKLAKINLSSS